MKKLITRSKHLLFALAALVVGASPAWAETLTVCDDTSTNNYVPFYGYYADAVQRGQMIYPSSYLEDLTGKEISQMVFYLKSIGTSGSNVGDWIVSLATTEAETLTAIDETTTLTQVFSGAITHDATNKTITIKFDEGFVYTGNNLLVEFNHPVKGGYKDYTFYGVSAGEGSAYTYNAKRSFLPKVTFTYATPISGPGLSVFSDGTKIENDFSYSFKLATAGTEKAFTLKNPGTESITLNVTATNGFGATLSSNTIEAKGEAALTVTMAEETATGSVTITPTTTDVAPFTINVSGTVKDANKVFISFSDAKLPTGWTATGYSNSYSSYNWSFSEGYASYEGGLASKGTLTSPALNISNGEKIFIDYARYGSYTYTTAGLTIEISSDGTEWTLIGSVDNGDINYGTWNTLETTVPTDAKFMRISGGYIHITNIYGGEEPNEPRMDVTQPASLDFGAITENATKTFTIANTGKATLAGISVTSSNSSIFAITGAPTSLEAGASQEVTITMSATQTGALSSEITVSATDMEDVKFTVTGAVVPKGLMVVDFNDNALPEGWSNNASNKWSFADGKAYCTYAAELVTPKLQILEGDLLVITVTSYDDYDNNYLEIYGSADGSTWSEFEAKKYISRSQIPYGSYTTLIVTDFPTTTKYLKFKGYYVRIDEVAGLTYAPNLAVTKEGETISSPAIYDFGEKLNADATVTYNFANAGAGTINISNVAISGAGAAAYSTNWTESVAAPFDLVITRTYDGNRTGVQEAVVTVTTTDGDFVINVSGSDQGLNAPELSIDTTPIDFGKLVANDTKTITVTNAGTGQLSVNIASDNELFTVSPAQLADIAAGESKTFDVTFNYNDVAGNFGAKNANITVTPTYDGSSNVIISAMAYAKDPAIWSEEFTNDPTTDRGWTADAGWSFANGVAVGGGSNYLTTPYLTVNGPSDELTFEYEATANYTLISYYISKDHGTWSSANYIPEDYATSYESLNNGDKGTITITGLEAGVYQFRFKGGNYTLDNFEGLKRFIPEHDAEISSVNIPANGYENRKYTATVSVKEKLGKEETATAKLYFGENEMATAEMALTANDETTAELSFTPTEAMNSQTAKIVVTYAGGVLTSTTKSVTINPVAVYAETETNTITSGTNHIVLKRSFISGWNTICLPFQVNDPEAAFGTGIKVYAFDSYSATDGLSFSSIKLTNGMEAKTPYLLYIPETINVGDLGEIFFPNAWVSTSSPEVTKGGVTFTGTYSPMEAGTLTGNYVLTTEAKIAKAGVTASMKGFRAYFTAPAGARMIINIDGEATGIGTITTDGELELGTMYNLQGQKVQGAQKGLYIINGKKVVRK